MKDENLRLIQRYFDKELKGEELNQFKKKLIEDGEFAKDVKKFAGTLIGLRVSEKLKKQKKTIVFKSYWKPLAIAASILFIISLGYLLFHNKNQNDINKITKHNNDSIKDTTEKKQIEKEINPFVEKDDQIANNSDKSQFKIIKTTGEIIESKTKKILNTGDEIFGETLVEFKSSRAKAALVDVQTKKLILLTAENIPNHSSITLKSHITDLTTNSVRSGSFEHIANIEKYFGNHFVILSKAFFLINSKNYPMDEDHFFYIRYTYNGQEINKRLDFDADTLFIDKEKLYQVDDKPIAKPDNNTVKLYYMSGENKSILTSTFNLIFLDIKNLHKEVGVFWSLIKNENFDKKLDKVLAYINEFYGKPNRDNIEIWLKYNFH